jgi:hypothetical protein
LEYKNHEKVVRPVGNLRNWYFSGNQGAELMQNIKSVKKS